MGDAAGAGIETEQSWDRTIPPDPGALAEQVLRVRARLPEYQTAARARAAARAYWPGGRPPPEPAKLS